MYMVLNILAQGKLSVCTYRSKCSIFSPIRLIQVPVLSMVSYPTVVLCNTEDSASLHNTNREPVNRSAAGVNGGMKSLFCHVMRQISIDLHQLIFKSMNPERQLCKSIEQKICDCASLPHYHTLYIKTLPILMLALRPLYEP